MRTPLEVPMKRSLMTLSTLAGATVAATACGGGGSGYGTAATPSQTSAAVGAPAAPPTTVALGNTSLGSVIVDNQGRTLYLFEPDAKGRSACTSSGCVAEWPPLTTTGAPQATGGLMASALGTTTRADGTQQVTYDGHPLYRFAGDNQAGATGGQGINDNGGLWFAVRTDGTAAVR
jgi:predicted lipoprotein with Yx(FWY)xxD motif